MPTPEELQQDKEFMAANPADQQRYLMANDPSFKSGTSEDQAAYLAHVTKAPTGDKGMLDTANDYYEKGKDYGASAAGRIALAPVNLAKSVYKAATDKPQDQEEERIDNSVPGLGRVSLAAKRLITDPSQQTIEQEQHRDLVRASQGKSHNGVLGNAFEDVTAAIPVVGPVAHNLAQRDIDKKDATGAVLEGLGYAGLDPVLEKAKAPKGEVNFPTVAKGVRGAGKAVNTILDHPEVPAAIAGGAAGLVHGGPVSALEGAAAGAFGGSKLHKIMEKAPRVPKSVTEYGLPKVDVVGNDFVPPATEPVPAAKPAGPLGRVEYGDQTPKAAPASAEGLVGNDFVPPVKTEMPGSRVDTEGRIPYGEPADAQVPKAEPVAEAPAAGAKTADLKPEPVTSKTPEDTAVDALQKTYNEVKIKADKAKATRDAYKASEAQGIPVPKEVEKAHVNAQNKLAEAELHLDTAKEAAQQSKTGAAPATEKPITAESVQPQPGVEMRQLGEQPAPAATPSPLGRVKQPELGPSVETSDAVNQKAFQGKVDKARAMKANALKHEDIAKSLAENVKPLTDTERTAKALETGKTEKGNNLGHPAMSEEAPVKDKGAALRAENEKKQTPLGRGERRQQPLTPKEMSYRQLIDQAVKDLGRDATDEQLDARIEELKKDQEPAKPYEGEERRVAKEEPEAKAEEKPAVKPLKTEAFPETGALTNEDHETVAKEQISRLPNEDLKKLMDKYGLDPESYNFNRREALREGGQKHPVERYKAVDDLMKKLTAREIEDLGHRAADIPHSADTSNKAKAERAKSLFPQLREEAKVENITPNGSGESAASQEAINRTASEKSNGTKRVRIDTRSGKETPIVGTDAADVKAGPYDTIVKRTAEGDEIVDQGNKARPTSFKEKAKAAVKNLVSGEEGSFTVPFTGSDKASVAEEAEKPNAPMFYSKAAKIADEKLGGSAPGNSILSTLKNAGVKDDEIKWMGLDDYLKDKPKVSKSDVQKFINENQIKLGEKNLKSQITSREGLQAQKEGVTEQIRNIGSRNPGSALGQAITKWLNADEGSTESTQKLLAHPDVAGNYTLKDALVEHQELEDRLNKTKGQEPADGPAKYEKYIMDGPKENYTEKLLTLPRKVTEENKPFTMSTEANKAYDDYRSELMKKYNGVEDGGTTNSWDKFLPEEKAKFIELSNKASDENRANDAGISKLKGTNKDYQSGHFDEPNILAHVRHDDRIDTDGKKNLFLEEVQSDWHQTGKQQGYRKEAPQEVKDAYEKAKNARADYIKGIVDRINKLRDEQTPEVKKENGITGPLKNVDPEAYLPSVIRNAMTEEEKGEFDRLNKQATDSGYEVSSQTKKGVPQAPFKNDWHELAMKRMLREAAEKGYDKLSWTTGEQQADRYDLSHQISRVEYDPEDSNLRAYDHNNKRVVNENVDNDVDELAKYIGAEPAKKLSRQIDNYEPNSGFDSDSAYEYASGQYEVREIPSDKEGEEDYEPKYGVYAEWNGDEEPLSEHDSEREAERARERNIENEVQSEAENYEPQDGELPSIDGLDLKVGGEWAHNLYDRAIPNFMNKYLKKWGGKVESSYIPKEKGEDNGLHFQMVDANGHVYDAFRTKKQAEDALSDGMHIVDKSPEDEKVHSIEITPEMKKSFLKEGQPIAKNKEEKETENENA